MIPRSVADGFAFGALLLAAIAAAVGLVASGLYRDTAEMVREARAADLVTLVAAVPALGLGLWQARSGSARGRLIAIGTLGYLSYSYAIFAFSVVINPMTPVHIAILGLAAWSFLLAVFGLDQATLDRAARIRLPRRTAGGFLIVVVVLFALEWLGQIMTAITTGTLPVSVSDLEPADERGLCPRPCVRAPVARHRRRLADPARPKRPGGRPCRAWLHGFDGTVRPGHLCDRCQRGIDLEPVPVVIFGVVTGIAAALAGLALFSAPRERAR